MYRALGSKPYDAQCNTGTLYWILVNYWDLKLGCMPGVSPESYGIPGLEGPFAGAIDMVSDCDTAIDRLNQRPRRWLNICKDTHCIVNGLGNLNVEQRAVVEYFLVDEAPASIQESYHWYIDPYVRRLLYIMSSILNHGFPYNNKAHILRTKSIDRHGIIEVSDKEKK